MDAMPTRLGALTAALAIVAAAGCSPAPSDAEGNAAAAPNAVHPQSASPAAQAPVEPAAAQAPELFIDGGGLRLVDARSRAVRKLPFGTVREAVMAALAFRGPAELGANDECGAGPMQFAGWKDGLQLAFQDGKFVGWWIDNRGPSTLSTGDGLFVGATRADVQASGTRAEIFESTLGTEFTVGEIGGLLDGPGSAANVTDLWAGTTCTFR